MTEGKVPPYQTFATQIPADIDPSLVTHKQQHTFERPSKSSVVTVAALGTNQATAAPLPFPLQPVNTVSGADAAKGVILPIAATGTEVEIYNSAAAILLVYPGTSGTINGGSANAPISMAAKTHARFVNIDGTNWAARYS